MIASYKQSDDNRYYYKIKKNSDKNQLDFQNDLTLGRILEIMKNLRRLLRNLNIKLS